MNSVDLIAQRVRFYSDGDEESFFSRLGQLAEVKEVVGIGDRIVIKCERSMTDETLRELLALFFRYRVDLSQLDVFATDENRNWFMAENTYWRRSDAG